MTVSEDADALSELVALVAQLTGVDPEVLPREALRRVLATESVSGSSLERVLARAQAGEAAIRERLNEAAAVGETYFFRNPDQLDFVARELIPSVRESQGAAPEAPLRAWSAGCATGEEAYTIAGLLLGAAGGPAHVLGTDLLARHVQRAREGRYGKWSIRATAPLRYPIVRERDGDYLVADEVRAITSFSTHNLLDPAPGTFELIFCRNVLVYFSGESATRVVANLARALAPGGALVLGPLDGAKATLPRGLVPIGPAEFQVFGMKRPASSVAPSRPESKSTSASGAASGATPAKAPSPPGAPSVTSFTPPRHSPVPAIELHLTALAAIERGELTRARDLLRVLALEHADYLPGRLEQALILARTGQVAVALPIMRDVARRLRALDPDEILEAPEPTPASFFAASAKAFLQRYDGRSP